jgi:hypothetical protein
LPPKNSRLVADLPEHLDLGRHRDASWWSDLAARWVVLGLLTAFAIAALFSLFGQHPETSIASGEAATLEVSAPEQVRGGLFFQGRFTVEANERLDHATLVLDEGWTEQLSVNTIAPAPEAEESRDGRLALDYGALEPGETLVAYLQFQVNPASLGRRSQAVRLADGERVLAEVDRTITVFP